MLLVLPEDGQGMPKVGAKAFNLQVLTNAKYPVPAFVIFPVEAVDRVLSGERGILQTAAEEIIKTLPSARYAVRSSATTEDSAHASFAGQFLTKIQVDPANLAGALEEVIFDAQKKLSGKKNLFAVLVQEYIPADLSGVLFTRNPNEGREMFLEYHEGIGEDIVSGRVKPKRKSFFHTQVFPKELRQWAELVEFGKRIELAFSSPQDIEWCKKGSDWYILQSRPITTLGSLQFQESLFLDENLPKDAPFLYEKTEISEIASRPTPITFSLLERIYAKNGPVAQAHNSQGVSYQERNQLKLIGNELFIDREEELQSLLPSYSYFGRKLFEPTSVRLKGVLRALKNIAALKNMNPEKEYARLLAMMRKKLMIEEHFIAEVSESLNYFLEEYSFVVEVNMFAAKALKDAELALKNESVSMASILGTRTPTDDVDVPFDVPTQNLRGNSLELADIAPFFSSTKKAGEDAATVAWWAGLMPERKEEYLMITATAKHYDKLRELGRIRTVQLINMLRSSVLAVAEAAGVSKDDVYFLTLDELAHHSFDRQKIKIRKEEYNQYKNFNFPVRLTHVSYQDDGKGPMGVSMGIAEGILTDATMFEKVPGKKILFTKVLSPDLTAHFANVTGILSEQGGLLSHLSIVAREQGLPVIVGWKPDANSGIKLGDYIRIDGGTGKISLVEK